MSERELDKFVRNFLIRAVQIVVESRLGDGLLTSTACSPDGHDWFNLTIKDIRDVASQAKSCLDKNSASVRDRWSFCVEISLKTSDGETMVLEYWVVTNEPSSSSSAFSSPPPNIGKSSTGSAHKTSSSPSSPKILSSGSSPLTLRRLSFEEEVYQVYNRMSLMLKSLITFSRAVPAFKLSSSQSADSFVICYRVYFVDNVGGGGGGGGSSPSPTDGSGGVITTRSGGSGGGLSGGANMIMNETTSSTTSTSTTSRDAPPPTIDQRLIPDCTTRKSYSPFTPLGSIVSSVSKLSVFCMYREEMTSQSGDEDPSRLLEDVPEPATLGDVPLDCIVADHHRDKDDNSTPDPSNQSQQQQQQQPQVQDFDTEEARTDILPPPPPPPHPQNEPLHIDDSHFDFDVKTRSLRASMKLPTLNLNASSPSPKHKKSTIISAQKHEADNDDDDDEEQVEAVRSRLDRSEFLVGEDNYDDDIDDEKFQVPLNAAFAIKAPKQEDDEDLLPELPETPFDNLIDLKPLSELAQSLQTLNDDDNDSPTSLKDPPTEETDSGPKSNPIAIPKSSKGHAAAAAAARHSASPIHVSPATGGGGYGSSAESFVMIDYRPPFAAPNEESSSINSFFLGPSPTFSGQHLSHAELVDLPSQLADIESSVALFDSFVDSLTASVREDEELGLSHSAVGRSASVPAASGHHHQVVSATSTAAVTAAAAAAAATVTSGHHLST